MTQPTFDMEAALKALREGQDLTGKEGILKASERWTHPVQNWNLTLSQMAIHFPKRLDGHIDL